MDSLAFWNEVRRRRNHFFLVWVGWLVAGPILILLYSSIIPGRDDAVAPFLALGSAPTYFDEVFLLRRQGHWPCNVLHAPRQVHLLWHQALRWRFSPRLTA
jgi:hypothetical protein